MPHPDTARPADPAPTTYTCAREASSRFLPVRGLQYHCSQWGEPQADTPLLVMVHGFMDVGASFQFVVDAMARLPAASGQARRCVVAPDWRGFGLTQAPTGTDAYWFPDYVADLDALLAQLSPDSPVDLLGHSLGGNIVMSYAGARPQRIRRLVNLEGFGVPDVPPRYAAPRLAKWLDQLNQPQHLKPYASLADVAARMCHHNPRLKPEKALWLAAHWAEQASDGQWLLRADPAHRRINPVPSRGDEAMATWSRISAPLLWVQGRETRTDEHWQGKYSFDEFQTRLAHVPQVQQVVLDDAGHMLHHDQPEALAQVLAAFFDDARDGQRAIQDRAGADDVAAGPA